MPIIPALDFASLNYQCIVADIGCAMEKVVQGERQPFPPHAIRLRRMYEVGVASVSVEESVPSLCNSCGAEGQFADAICPLCLVGSTELVSQHTVQR